MRPRTGAAAGVSRLKILEAMALGRAVVSTTLGAEGLHVVNGRDLLLGDVWGYTYTGGTRTVDVHVRRLREKLPVLVEALVTVKQFGYKVVDNEVT